MTPELSRPVAAASVGDRPETVDIVASPDERRALAQRFGLVSVDRLTGSARLRRALARDGSGAVIRVDFDFKAEVVQTCVVTLRPVPTRCGEAGLVVEYAEGEEEAAVDVPPPGGIDPPERLKGGVVELGELLAQHLGLALDPWPRAPGAAFSAPGGEERAGSPFAVLETLRAGKRDASG